MTNCYPLNTGAILHSRYQITKYICEVGTCNIYLAHDRQHDDSECAIKEFLFPYNYVADYLNCIDR